MKNVLIIGAGAIGIAIGTSISTEGMVVSFLARSGTKNAIENGGIKRIGLFGEIEVAPDNISVYGLFEEMPKGFFDYVIICTKTLANKEVAKQLGENADILASSGKIVIMQNGWGNDQYFLNYFSKEQVYQARVITGFARPEPNVSNITAHQAPILLGSLYGCDTSCLEPLAEAINASGIPSETTGALIEALWAKMLFNTTLNPLGAILDMTYGQLADCRYSKAIMGRLIEETYAVLDACGYKTLWENAEAYKDEFFGKLVPDTYAHRSSTLQDIEKKQKTEIHTLNGYIVKLAEEHGIEVPTHKMICELILSLEESF